MTTIKIMQPIITMRFRWHIRDKNLQEMLLINTTLQFQL